ncbi:MAG: Cof-type HAD-IIB family hydrolase [Candidatus Gastranaerophilales bacterium]|nr:Cof-type HAD-IIB family hydrolase [Candidatus Gastranaerophilales bacterium]
MIKMLVCDIDGTIYNGQTFTENLLNCIKKIKKDGIKFVIATGRTFYSANQVIAPLEVDTPVICYQGATIHDCKTGEMIFEKGLDRDLSLDILDFLRKKDIYPNIYINDELYAEKETKYVQNYSDKQLIPYRIIPDISKNDFKTLNKILVIDDDTKLIEDLTAEVKQRYGDKVYTAMSTPYFCEICAAGISKGTAVHYVADMYGIKKEEIMSCGDQNNDIELLTCAGVGVAMGNATDTLKSYADYITDTIENDGVVKAVDKFIYGVN